MESRVPADFSVGLFWDIDSAMLDIDRHRKYVVARVLEAGTFDDWQLLCRLYTLDGVIDCARHLRTLDPKALAFLTAVGHVPKESFRCCTTQPSPGMHWIC